uniref:Pentacotripeptide-repeat region of PRORP domain-containing protein n=1 Tax=Chromera velia CCMP2878 TaxID=1169474 RepID=A0A0G4FJ84_9ALVE|eukprot:Cvel_17342.t1-p1 / transcript=Cvel_17342.t1 / gene=Cvel_17342 / organism=Chromera_velia_CCMP2878 / gene_product=hypothetical protein / transcript_product=hypothetical protein / location=Cvel_scaffold1378:13935-19091(-) / protein_length=452 / sequence_SO=supercontig / SO=protein_coding / is_pseudo=false
MRQTLAPVYPVRAATRRSCLCLSSHPRRRLLHTSVPTRARLATGEEVTRTLLKGEEMGRRVRTFFQREQHNRHRLDELELFKVWRQCSGEHGWKAALFAMNQCYNNGKHFRHYETPTRLLALAVENEEWDEAVELVKYFPTWLQFPPDTKLIYTLMRHFLETGKFRKVRELTGAVRESWQIPLEPPLYGIVIKAMVAAGGIEGIEEALMLFRDAQTMQVPLQPVTYTLLLEKCLEGFEVARRGEHPEEDEASEHDRADDQAESASQSGALGEVGEDEEKEEGEEGGRDEAVSKEASADELDGQAAAGDGGEATAENDGEKESEGAEGEAETPASPRGRATADPYIGLEGGGSALWLTAARQVRDQALRDVLKTGEGIRRQPLGLRACFAWMHWREGRGGWESEVLDAVEDSRARGHLPVSFRETLKREADAHPDSPAAQLYRLLRQDIHLSS